MNEKIQKLFDFYKELDPLAQKSSEMLNAVKDANKDQKVTVKRKFIEKSRSLLGKETKKAVIREVEVTEKDLWDEIYWQAATAPEARGILKERYPEVFEVSERYDVLHKEMIKYCVTELGINPDQIEFGKMLKLIVNIVDWKLNGQRTDQQTPV